MGEYRMTREEAKKILQRDLKILEGNKSLPDGIEAMKVAIQALEQEPCEDTISRQAVIDCFKKWQPYMATRLHDFEKELFDLPSVQPMKKRDDVWDKIRAEIMSKDGLEEALEIIDKYEAKVITRGNCMM